VTAQIEFTESTARYRRELLAHCYRMLGTLDEAEDLVQETYLRAWKSFDGFKGESSLRVWLYRIATNACLTALQNRGRRPLPSGLGAPSDDPDAPPIDGSDVPWLQPIPDALVEDPADVVASRDSLRLALLASFQHLPARQRAVLILRDVLAFRATEVATMLGTTTTAVKSLLQRARTQLADVAPEQVEEPTEPRMRELLGLYMAAFENADLTALEKALRQDAALEMIPSRTWFDGRKTCLRFISYVLGSRGDWQMTPTRANGQPGVVVHWRGQPYGVVVLTITATGISRIVLYSDPGLVPKFGP
jgi:RNA polymerase sigma-70 factor, ECF subfamily